MDICNLQFTIYKLQITIYNLLSTIYNLLSTIYYLQFTIYYLKSKIYKLLSKIYNLLSKIYNFPFYKLNNLPYRDSSDHNISDPWAGSADQLGAKALHKAYRSGGVFDHRWPRPRGPVRVFGL